MRTDKYLCQDGDSGEYQLVIYLGSKKEQVAIAKGEEFVNDLLSAISFTIDKYPKKGSIEFRTSLKKISKKLWMILK